MTTATMALYTAEEFLTQQELGIWVELVNRKVIQMPPAFPRHGQICAKTVCL